MTIGNDLFECLLSINNESFSFLARLCMLTIFCKTKIKTKGFSGYLSFSSGRLFPDLVSPVEQTASINALMEATLYDLSGIKEYQGLARRFEI